MGKALRTVVKDKEEQSANSIIREKIQARLRNVLATDQQDGSRKTAITGGPGHEFKDIALARA